MDIKQTILDTQTTIIEGLARCEDAISQLYAVYAVSVPTMQKFWQDLSRKEEQHAVMLRSMQKQLRQGSIFKNIGRFQQADIDAFHKNLRDAANHARGKTISEEEAIKTALGIESSVLDAHFYDIVTSDAAEYRIIAGKLSADTHAHVKHVREKLQEIQSNGARST